MNIILPTYEFPLIKQRYRSFLEICREFKTKSELFNAKMRKRRKEETELNVSSYHPTKYLLKLTYVIWCDVITLYISYINIRQTNIELLRE
jgi:hypothetical protein